MRQAAVLAGDTGDEAQERRHANRDEERRAKCDAPERSGEFRAACIPAA
jgi:hypothetical protein